MHSQRINAAPGNSSRLAEGVPLKTLRRRRRSCRRCLLGAVETSEMIAESKKWGRPSAQCHKVFLQPNTPHNSGALLRNAGMSEPKDETCARLGGTGAFACTASGYAACPAERLEAAQRAGQRPAPQPLQDRIHGRLVAWLRNLCGCPDMRKLCGIRPSACTGGNVCPASNLAQVFRSFDGP
jgi:hypothetical protein